MGKETFELGLRPMHIYHTEMGQKAGMSLQHQHAAFFSHGSTCGPLTTENDFSDYCFFNSPKEGASLVPF